LLPPSAQRNLARYHRHRHRHLRHPLPPSSRRAASSSSLPPLSPSSLSLSLSQATSGSWHQRAADTPSHARTRHLPNHTFSPDKKTRRHRRCASRAATQRSRSNAPAPGHWPGPSAGLRQRSSADLVSVIAAAGGPHGREQLQLDPELARSRGVWDHSRAEPSSQWGFSIEVRKDWGGIYIHRTAPLARLPAPDLLLPTTLHNFECPRPPFSTPNGPDISLSLSEVIHHSFQPLWTWA
jgi:hypothetical protein